MPSLILQYNIPCHISEGELRITFLNGSIISLNGFDTEAEAKKIKGDFFDLVCIDETQDIADPLLTFIYAVCVSPGLMDRGGTIVFSGTPGPVESGLYYKCCNNQQPGWRTYSWTFRDNPFLEDAEAWFKQEKEDRGLTDDDPIVQREYFSRWVKDANNLLFKFNEDRNLFPDKAPDFSKGNWNYVLGVDLGYEDMSAFVVIAYDYKVSHHAWILECQEEQHADFTRVAEIIRSFQKAFPDIRVITDAANKQGCAELINRHSIPIEAAEKGEKAFWIVAMNDDMRRGLVKVHSSGCKDLISQWNTIQVDPKAGNDPKKRIEKPGSSTKCDLADAALYGWRYAYGYLYSAPEPKKVKKQFQFDLGLWLQNLNKEQEDQMDRNPTNDEYIKMDLEVEDYWNQ